MKSACQVEATEKRSAVLSCMTFSLSDIIVWRNRPDFSHGRRGTLNFRVYVVLTEDIEGFFIHCLQPKEGANVPVSHCRSCVPLSQLCLLCVRQWAGFLLWSHLNFLEGEEAPAVFLFPNCLPYIDQIVCCLLYPPIELSTNTNVQPRLLVMQPRMFEVFLFLDLQSYIRWCPVSPLCACLFLCLLILQL